MTIKVTEYPRIVIDHSWEDDQEFPNTPQIRELLNFYDHAVERAATMAERAVSERDTGNPDVEKTTKQAIYWKHTKRAMYMVISLLSSDPDLPLKEALYDPYIK